MNRALFKKLKSPRLLLTLMGLACFTASPALAQVIHPMKITGNDSQALATPDVKKNELYKYRVMGRSTDKKVRAGISLTTVKRTVDDGEANPVDEFLFIVKGRERYTSLDGTVVEVKAGDAVFIPRGWKGKWETFGTVEFYVIYDPDHALPEKESGN
jgi:uncharacterized cupin superfamily protein